MFIKRIDISPYRVLKFHRIPEKVYRDLEKFNPMAVRNEDETWIALLISSYYLSIDRRCKTSIEISTNRA